MSRVYDLGTEPNIIGNFSKAKNKTNRIPRDRSLFAAFKNDQLHTPNVSTPFASFWIGNISEQSRIYKKLPADYQ